MISNAWLVGVSFGKTNPKDLLQLATTLSSVPRIRAILEGMEQPALAYLIEQLDAIPELESLISAAIAPEAPHVITDGVLSVRDLTIP